MHYEEAFVNSISHMHTRKISWVNPSVVIHKTALDQHWGGDETLK